MRRQATSRIPATLLLIVLAAGGCGEESRQRPGVEALPPLPADVSEQDPPVRRLFEDRRSALERLLADPGVDRRAVGRGFGELAMVFHAYEYWDEADRGYRRAAELAPGTFRWRYYRGRVAHIRGAWEVADAAFARALEIQPLDVPALVTWADSLAERGRAAEAEQLYRRALEVDPHCARASYGLGRLALDRGQVDVAVQRLEAAYAEAPSAAATRYTLGLALRGAGELDRAAELMRGVPSSNILQQKVPVRDPLMAELDALRVGGRAHVLRGVRALAEGRPEMAALEFRQALAADSDRTPALYGLGVALERSDREAEAEAVFRQLLEGFPDHAAGHLALGSLLARRGRLGQAESHLRLAVRLDPSSAEAREALDRLLDRRERRQAGGEGGSAFDP